MTINIKEYLENRPARYDFTSYSNFLRDVAPIKLVNAIHITGTNGKGSSARYLAKTLEYNGYKVGLFISPHFSRFNELATINDVEISDDYIASQIYKYETLFNKHSLSAFEIMTFICFNYFIDSNVDYTVVEVGMGGLKDATNIFTPLLSVITNIGLDHVNELGPTLTDVAKHKAGIIKRNIPLLVGNVTGEALDVLKEEALKLHAPLLLENSNPEVIKRFVTETTFKYYAHTFKVASGAHYEVINASLVWRIFKYLKELNDKLEVKNYKKALMTPTYSGRFSVVSMKPLIIIDGAHNPHAVRALLNDVMTLNKKVHIVYATYSDKDYTESLNMLSLLNTSVTLTTFNHPRALQSFNDETFMFIRDHELAIKQTIKKLGPNDLLLVIGSLYFATLVTREFKEGIYAL